MSERPATATSSHLAVEEVAAFLDGRLAGAERERAVAHLADCEECYELFAATARTLRDEEAAAGGVAPPAAGEGATTTGAVLRPRAGRWGGARTLGAVALAAAAVVAVVTLTPVGDILLGRPPDLAPARLAAALPPAAGLSPTVAAEVDAHGWPVTRGAGPAFGPQEQVAFRLGVRVVETELALAAGDRELAERLTYRLESLLETIELSDPLRVLYAGEEGIRGRLAAGEPPAALLHLNQQGDDLLGPDPADDHPGYVDGFWYDFGKWAAAARLAAAARDGSFYRQRPVRRFLGQLEERELPPGLAPAVAAVTAELRRGEPSWQAVERHLAALIAVAGGGRPPAG